METTIISNNFPKEQQKQLNYPCKVRFQSLHSNNINGIIAQPLPKIDSLPQTRWRRFGSLKLISNKNKEQNQQQIRPLAAMSAIALRQQQSVRRLLTTTEEEDEDDDDDDDDEDETSSNSVPLNNTKTASNGFDGRKNLMQGERGKEEKMSSAGFHSSQSGNSAKALFLAMHQNRSKSSTTSPNVLTNNDHKRRRKSKESASGSIGSFHSKLCFFGVLRIETGARLFLFFYIALSACGVIMGSVATMVWVLVPLVVVPLAAYSLSRHTSKCLYPFLVVSVIHSLVSFGMTIIVGCFSLLCFDQLKEHFALTSSQSLPHSSSNSPSLQHFTSSLHSDPILPFFASSNSTSMTALFYCALTMILSLALAIFFFWQSTVLFSCISHFDILSQQRKQHEQQLKQSTAIGLESRVHSLASATADFKGTQTAIGTLSHPMECSQCISEIRQLDQFSELRASFRQC